MSLRFPVRRATRVAAPFLFAIAVAMACADRHDGGTLAPLISQTREGDADFVDAVVTGVQIRTSLRIRLRGLLRPFSGLTQATIPILQFVGTDDDSMTLPGYSRQVINHVMDNGVAASIAVTRDASTGVPIRILVYENGHLRFSSRPRYIRYGGGWVRQSSDDTLFTETGDTAVAAHSEVVSPTLAARRAPVDALRQLARVFFPAELHAQSAPCGSGWINYAVASLGVAAGITAVTGAAAECGATIIGCPAAGTAVLGFSLALGNWNNALDKLIAACGYNEPTRKR
jgi:hypothetical protein